MIVLSDRSTGEVVFEGRSVSRRNRCPVCGHDTWCLVDGVRGVTICPRTESPRRIGDAGWMHHGDGVPRSASFDRKTDELLPMEGAEAMLARFQRQCPSDRIAMLALSLGLSFESLCAVQCGWNGSAYTFPMRNHRRDIVGFRTRTERGEKFAIKGSRSGMFLPVSWKGDRSIVWIVEGPTDVAAMHDMGLYAIGRPSCMGCEEEIARCVRGAVVVIVADNDEAGERGARSLERTIRGSVRACQTIKPPMGLKDARQVLNHGGVKSDWLELITPTRRQETTNGLRA